MKRYWLFAFQTYYPNGGMHDLVAMSDEAAPLLKLGAKLISQEEREADPNDNSYFDHWHVVDSTTLEVVAMNFWNKEGSIVSWDGWEDRKNLRLRLESVQKI